MPKFLVRPEGQARGTLAVELERMAAMLRADEVNLNDLGKSLAAVVGAARQVFIDAGLPSVRMDAAVKALDLRSKKSELERFVRPSAGD